MSTSASNQTVIIVGGGPVGLSLAGDLGWRGIDCILLEESDGRIYQPKMDGVNVRTMEFCRRWGISDAVHGCDYPQDVPQDMVYLTSFTGFELGRESFTKPSGTLEDLRKGASPEVRARCPQNLFDPILQHFARAQPSTKLLYNTRFLGYRETEAGVEVDVEDFTSGERRTLNGAYLVGCDGASSSVRKALGIEMVGNGALTYTTNVIFRCKDFWSLHDKRYGYRHLLVGPEGVWGTCVAINGRDQWRLSIIGTGEPRKLNPAEIDAAIERTLGKPFEFEVLTMVPWVRRELVAQSYRKGRIFIAGDSAHVMSPTGGFGMNTGIADAVDLSWKLEAALRGWGGERLLDSYSHERLPVAARAAREASGNLLRTLSPGANPGLLDKTFEAGKLRYEVGRRYSASMLREWYKLGVDLGYEYGGSAVIGPDDAKNPVDDLPVMEWLAQVENPSPTLIREWHKLSVHMTEGTPVKLDREELHPGDVMIYRGLTRPGARAAHVWLNDGSSTLDLFGKSFVLLVMDADESGVADEMMKAAQACGMPLKIERCDDPLVRQAYGAAFSLVRPDGHVAWRGNGKPSIGSAQLIDTVRGL
ncbi:FAD-dependent monooxygenase [Roseiarcaceae bacterium H3SJ34-1]|uniref:FAD-dependent monooxygenase n=1 Tax=Terripilifer ovatus TaxID=3032367 RepID=UPI003AB9484F|nr:FAD-dependent monooxygenase [Roseiarcaceae bacterium H3SJ34-1]